jgi:starvation-inducible DNA-binding protein
MAMKNIKLLDTSKSLATPNDLGDVAVKAVIKAINPLIADVFSLYVKTKNFHWHMSGSHYRDYHLMLDEQSNQLFAMIDVLAERVRKLGGLTIRSIDHIQSLQRIPDDNETFVKPQDMLRRLMDDNKMLASYMRAAHQVCDDKNDVATASFLEVYIDETERRIWFLFETISNRETR